MRRRHKYYDRRTQPITGEQYLELLVEGAEETRRVMATDFPNVCSLSTAWLGIDHGHGTQPPMIFETMVFVYDGIVGFPWEDWLYRYSLIQQAIKGHRIIEKAIGANLLPDDVIAELQAL